MDIIYEQFIIQGGLIRKLLHKNTGQSSKEIHSNFSVPYQTILVPLVKSVQEQQPQIEELKKNAKTI
jgi:hypothetical protein